MVQTEARMRMEARMLMDRDRARELGFQTLQYLTEGHYPAPTGVQVDISEAVGRAVKATVSYPPEASLGEVPQGSFKSVVEIRNETSLVAARRLVEAGERPLVLNFAAGRTPGGGFLKGARAQEESLCRSSGLYACLEGNPMYACHKACDCLYSHYAIYSPEVPVFRADDGTLLAQPWPCSFVTCAAVNARVVLGQDSGRRREIRAAMHERIHRVLAIAAQHGHTSLVLGAWGCGAFGNDPEEIAGLFHGALAWDFRGVFSRVAFAITDWSEVERYIGPFRKMFRVDW